MPNGNAALLNPLAVSLHRAVSPNRLAASPHPRAVSPNLPAVSLHRLAASRHRRAVSPQRNLAVAQLHQQNLAVETPLWPSALVVLGLTVVVPSSKELLLKVP